MNIETAENELAKITEKTGTREIEGEVIYLLDEAFHGCSPDMPNGWCAHAVMVKDGKISECGKAWWDFDEYVEENGEPEDAGDFPWEDTPSFDSGYTNDGLTDDPEEVDEIMEEALRLSN